MRRRWRVAAAAAIGALAPAAVSAEDGDGSPLDALVLDYETGPLAVLQNDNRYGAGGTEYGADEVNLRDNLAVSQRISVEAAIGRHTAMLLYAPLELTTRAVLSEDLRFRDEVFPAGEAVEHRYLFDGYRASYLFRLVDWEGLRLKIGGSAQIRNADVSLTALEGTQFANESDIGLVPALKIRARYTSASGVYALLDADGLSTFGLVGDTRGGLYDVALSLGLPVTSSFDALLRVRGYGGGADVPDEEIESWGHFLSFTAVARVALDQLL